MIQKCSAMANQIKQSFNEEILIAKRPCHVTRSALQALSSCQINENQVPSVRTLSIATDNAQEKDDSHG